MDKPVRNILFIMADQLRWDYLGYAGHPSIRTPNIDKLAQRGVNFTNSFVQGTVCGSSRASFYTGRYVSSHGATYNNYPLRADEWTLGDHLGEAGMRNALIGKTHMRVLADELSRIGIDPTSKIGQRRMQAGFEPYERDDGLHPDMSVNPNLRYNQVLRDSGFSGKNPWHEWANSAIDDNGDVVSGWYMRNAHLPARIPEQFSETAYMTDRAMQFMQEESNHPWCMHLSYIKPHWPYMAPEPYHNMYGVEDCIRPVRDNGERQSGNPVYQAYQQSLESRTFAEDECRQHVIPTYMGLISQLDDHLGRLFKYMENQGILDETMIVFTSDHGDYLGDHWLGEKEMFYEQALRIPMLIVDPRESADETRGTTFTDMVESIDLIPTLMDAAGFNWHNHILEGKSLMPAIGGESVAVEGVFCELDYSLKKARHRLQVEPQQSRGFMLRTDDWKYCVYKGFDPQLFDLKADPAELNDLGADFNHRSIRSDLDGLIIDFYQSRKYRLGISDAIISSRTGRAAEFGYLFGHW